MEVCRFTVFFQIYLSRIFFLRNLTMLFISSMLGPNSPGMLNEMLCVLASFTYLKHSLIFSLYSYSLSSVLIIVRPLIYRSIDFTEFCTLSQPVLLPSNFDGGLDLLKFSLMFVIATPFSDLEASMKNRLKFLCLCSTSFRWFLNIIGWVFSFFDFVCWKLISKLVFYMGNVYC